MSNEAVYHDAPKTTEDYAPKTTTATPRTTEEYGQTTTPVKVEPETIEKQDRGLFDFLGKKKEEEKKYEETPISSEFEQKVHVSEPEPKSEEQPETLFQKMSHSDSSSSSDDEECEDGEKKKKKKKPLTEQLKEKIEERKERKEEEEAKHEDDNRVPIEKYEEVAAPPSYTDVGDHTPTDVVHHETPVTEEKKGFMDKIKEKLPGGHKKPVEEQVVAPPPPTSTPAVVAAHETEGVEQPEKKGILEKIKDKIPGLHSKTEEEKEKEKVKECH